MKINKYKQQKKQRKGLILIGLFALITAMNVSFISIVPTILNEIEETDENEDNNIEVNLATYYVEPITVNNNWSDIVDTFLWCTGSGTAWDPYVISDVEINLNGVYKTGIEIQNSNANFVIRNCTIYNVEPAYYGIDLFNADNGIIRYNDLSYCDYGMYLLSSDNHQLQITQFITMLSVLNK